MTAPAPLTDKWIDSQKEEKTHGILDMVGLASAEEPRILGGHSPNDLHGQNRTYIGARLARRGGSPAESVLHRCAQGMVDRGAGRRTGQITERGKHGRAEAD